jgi:hypothetical protein
MNLKEAILNCNLYKDSDDFMHMVFAKRVNDQFESYSEATVIQLRFQEMEIKLSDIVNSKCPGFDYFLEMNIIQEFFKDIKNLEEFKSEEDKVKRIIYYTEFDA